MQHYMTYPTNTSAVCGTDMVGRRNSRTDSDMQATTCTDCLVWLADNRPGLFVADPVHFLVDRAPFTGPFCGTPYPGDGTGLTLSVLPTHVTCPACVAAMAAIPAGD